MEFIKKYTSHEEYAIYKTPNVSLCVENNEKHLHYTKKKFDNEYLTFEALESGTFTLTIGSAVTTGDVTSVSYSLDNGETWTTTNNVQGQKVTITTPTVPSGWLVMWKGNNRVMSSNASGTIQYMSCVFSSSGYYSVMGNIMSLIYGDDFKNKTSLVEKTFSFRSLFSDSSKLKNAKNLSLPATTLASYCYRNMFYNCTSLTDAPELPATTLADSCYQYMFYNCTSLTDAPELPATTLTSYCYQYMFSSCSSLTVAPELPATTLAGYCYNSMFSSCSSLTVAPELPATTLANGCYAYMFQGCRNLTTAPELPATTSTSSCYSSMFSNCTSLTTAPDLPATTLAQRCYEGMFSNCTSLTTAPELPATTLATYCYSSMFSNCTSLTTAPSVLPATTLAGSCYQNMFYSCTNLTTVPSVLPATTLAGGCCYGMFNGCTNLTVAPELPATTLASQCYEFMFQDCKSLTTAPELPATTLVNGCYEYMFNGCNKLKYIKCMIEQPNKTYTYEWVRGVSTNGVFVGSPSSAWSEGPNGVPEGWETNVQKLPSYDSNETIRIWIDDFSNGEEYVLDNGWDNINEYFDDYFETPSDFGGKPYEYTGEMIEWNGDDYYIWVFNDGAVENNDLQENCKYILTDTIDFQELDEMSVSYNYNNRICPYVAMLFDDLSTYEDGQDSDRFLVLVEDIS